MSEKETKKEKDDTPEKVPIKERYEVVHRFEKGKGFLDESSKDDIKENPDKDEDKPEKKPEEEKDDKSPKPPEEPPKISIEEYEAIKKRLEETESIIALEAEKAFQEEKTKFLEGIKDEDRRKAIEEQIGDDPEILEEFKRASLMVPVSTPTLTPKPKDGEGEGEGKEPTEPTKPKTEEELFKEEKEALLSTIEDEDRREEISKSIGDDPKTGMAKIADIKMWTGIIKTGIEQAGGTVTGTKRTAGKATLPPPDEGQAGAKEWIDTLYATMKDPSKSKEEKQKANQMLDELWMEVLKGLSMRARQGKSYTGYQVITCPECGNPIMAPRGTEITECDNCGWKKYPKGKKIYRR